MNKRDQERQNAWERVLPAIKGCSKKRGGATLFIESLDRKSSSSGIAEYFDVRVIRNVRGRPQVDEWLSWNLAKAFGYTFNKKRECISMGGYGYCRATQVASDIARKLGKPIYVQSTGFFAGPNGWVGKEH